VRVKEEKSLQDLWVGSCNENSIRGDGKWTGDKNNSPLVNRDQKLSLRRKFPSFTVSMQ
jgi:hypothetical protein